MKAIAAPSRYGKMLLALTLSGMTLQGWKTPALVSAFSADTSTQTKITINETGEYIVKFRNGASQKTTKLRAANSGATLAESSDQHMLIRLQKTSDEQALQSLATDPNVEYIEPNIRMYATASIEDPYYSEQWGLEQIQAPAAWEAANGDAGVTVAVIDTGVDYTHPDLKGRVDTANDYDYVNNDRDAKDDEGHGTHVAGIIAAKLNSHGIAGVAGDRNVKILALKALDRDGEGNMYDVATAIMDAADLGADVINLSLGAELEDGVESAPRTITDAVQYAINKGSLVVAAAGNDAANADRYIPASIPGVVTVSAVGTDLRLATFSNYGSSVDLAAPGVDILSTYPGGRYAYMSGTSQATPFVSGVAALLKASEPALSVNELTNRLLNTAADLGKTGRDNQYGYGLVNASRAIQSDSSHPTEPDPSDASITSLKADQSKLSLPPNGSGTITLAAYLKNGTKSAVAANDVLWQTKDKKIAVVENGLVTAAGFGKTTITATYGGKTVSVPVEIAVTKLTASKSSLTMKPDGTVTVELTATYGDKSKETVAAGEVTWKSQNEDIAVVQDGAITAKNMGSTYILATYGNKTVKIRVTVSITKLVASPNKILLKPGTSSSIIITASYGDENEVVTSDVDWKTGDAKVAFYREGEIVAKGFGSTTMTATYRGKSVRISVDTRLKQLQADTTRKTLEIGQTDTPVVRAAFSDGSIEQIEEGITWTSSNEKVATVGDNGEITAKAEGSTSITARYGEKTVRISIAVAP
ncbi:S8 family serine peptidase [Brevibacillus choshinensis]|uniref:S8 family serine peptidase n=1 Tax=Brevibacillus choshinensis TaxID=54911 RepID=UPI002E207968|nr:S8 family serine peptidase [Brevibacillus choshinensis]MED4754643.1 S8 family serine peptidase [Brevibacillus choshinensis]